MHIDGGIGDARSDQPPDSALVIAYGDSPTKSLVHEHRREHSDRALSWLAEPSGVFEHAFGRTGNRSIGPNQWFAFQAVPQHGRHAVAEDRNLTILGFGAEQPSVTAARQCA